MRQYAYLLLLKVLKSQSCHDFKVGQSRGFLLPTLEQCLLMAAHKLIKVHWWDGLGVDGNTLP